MIQIPLNAGRLVRSKAGRDSGRLFAVIEEIDEDFVLIANGSLRKLDRPKKKRRKHLKALPEEAFTPATGTVTDALLRKAIKDCDQKERG